MFIAPIGSELIPITVIVKEHPLAAESSPSFVCAFRSGTTFLSKLVVAVEPLQYVADFPFKDTPKSPVSSDFLREFAHMTWAHFILP